MSRKRIEDIFNETLGNDQEAYQQGDWEQVSRILDAGEPPVKEKRRRRWLFFLLPFILLCSVWLLWNNIKSKKEAQAATQTAAQGKDGSRKTTTASIKTTKEQTGSVATVPGATGKQNEEIAGSETANGLSSTQPEQNVPVTADAALSINSRDGFINKNNDKHFVPAGRSGIKNKYTGYTNDKKSFIGRERNDRRTKAGNYPAFNRRRNIRNNQLPAVNAAALLAVNDVTGIDMEPVQRIVIENEDVPVIQPEDQTLVSDLQKLFPSSTGEGVNNNPDTPKIAKRRVNPRSIQKNAWRLPQWVYIGYGIAPIASGKYYLNRNISNPPFTFNADPNMQVKASPTLLAAIGSEWYPGNDRWSLNSYLCLQTAKTQYVSKTFKANGTGPFEITTELKWMLATRAGADWVYHTVNNKWQYGFGLNTQYILIGQGREYIQGISTAPGPPGITSSGPTRTAFNGINRFNIGVSAVIDYRAGKRFALGIRTGWDVLDMTRNSYFNISKRHNLSYFSAGLKYMLSKEQ